MSLSLLLVLALTVSLSFGARTFIPATPFDPSSIEEAVYLGFSNGNLVVRGRGGLSKDDIDYSPGTPEPPMSNDGFAFGKRNPGFLSLSNIDFRGRSFFDTTIDSGLIFKVKVNFGNYSKFCATCDQTKPHTTCTNSEDESVFNDWDRRETLFTTITESDARMTLYLQRTMADKSHMGTCDSSVFYQVVLVHNSVTRSWNIASHLNIWLHDGHDHTFYLVVPRRREWTNTRQPLLYVDGKYLCQTTTAVTTVDWPAYCQTTFTGDTSGQISPGIQPYEFDLTKRCAFHRVYFGATPFDWGVRTSQSPDQPFNFQQPLYGGAILKEFVVWNHLGILAPSDSFLCGVNDRCFYYRNTPWCVGSDPQDAADIERRALRTCPATNFFSCGSLLSPTNCQWPGNACVSGVECCDATIAKCVPLGTLTHCGSCTSNCLSGVPSIDETMRCCSGVCVQTTTSNSHCYGCGQSCKSGEACCNSFRGCTGRDVACSTCSDNCIAKNTGPTTNYHCCPNTGSSGSHCVDFKANDNNDCGACGNKCSLRNNPAASQVFTCCSGTCVQIGDNENCAACGDVCKNLPGQVPQGCCNGGCTDLDTDANCGSCGHDCGEIGRQSGKTLHCCDGLCVEWNTLQTQCGCPATNCEQEYNLRLGVTSFHCCADADPPTSLPVCLDFTSDAACGGCGNVCSSGVQKCCADANQLMVCANLNAENSCGDCGINCGPKNIDSPRYCCAVTIAGVQTHTCTAFGTRDNCGACGDICGASRTCCLLAPVDALRDTQYGCKITYNDVNYCGDSCTDCTAGGTISNVLCCKGKCVEVLNTDDSCGCDDVRACTPGNKCCLSPTAVLLPGGIPDAHTCTALQTMSDCSTCNDACSAISQACCAVDPTSSACANLASDNMNCGKCGRVCAAGVESCCSGECRSILEHDNCGTCGNQCSSSQLCCNDNGNISCSPYLNSASSCGCPNNPQDCTILVPPPENHDGAYTCCKGHCFPTWENCMD